VKGKVEVLGRKDMQEIPEGPGKKRALQDCQNRSKATCPFREGHKWRGIRGQVRCEMSKPFRIPDMDGTRWGDGGQESGKDRYARIPPGILR